MDVHQLGFSIDTLDFQLDTAKDGKKTRNFVESWDFRFGVDADPSEKKLRVCLKKLEPQIPQLKNGQFGDSPFFGRTTMQITQTILPCQLE